MNKQAIKKEIKTILWKLGLENLMQWFSLLANPGVLFSKEYWNDYLEFKKRYKPLFFGGAQYGQPKNKFLIVNLHNIIAGLKQESLLAKTLQLNGFDPVFLTNRSGFWPMKYYRVFGFNQFSFFDDYVYRATQAPLDEKIEKSIQNLKTIEDVLSFEYKSVRIGKYALATMAREHRLANIDPASPDVGLLLRRYMHQSICNVEAAIATIENVKPTAILFLEKVYMPYGEIYSVSFNYGIDVLQWSACHRESAWMLKRYTPDTKDWDRSSVSDNTWKIMQEMPFSEEQARALKNELAETYQSGEWFSEAGTQSLTKIITKEEIQARLKLDPAKKTAVIFAHMFWDAVIFDSKDLFEDFERWLIATVKEACLNSNLNWVIKLHPANRVKAVRDNYQGEYSENISLKKNIGRLPDHIKILPPDTDISTYALFSVMDYCLTVRGTVGIEASSFGIPVITAGKGRYGGLGFTIDSKNREEYLDRLRKIHLQPKLTAEQTELAQKFAYAQFMLRPLKLQTLKIHYGKDKKATPKIDITAGSLEELRQAPDMKAFAGWVLSKDKLDYLSLYATTN